MNFSDELNNYIKILNCSAKEFSRKADLSPALISRYLNNKRSPKENSEYLEKIINAIYEISLEKKLNISKESISVTLKNTLNSTTLDYNNFVSNFNTIQEELKISTVDLAKQLGYDASFLSRIKSKERKPSDLENFINQFINYIVSSYQNRESKQKISSLLNCSLSSIEDLNTFKSLLKKWLTANNNQNETILNFLSKLDNFKLSDFINTDFEKTKVPTTPIIFKNSKTFFGIDGRKKAESEFLKTTLLSKSKEPIFFYSDLPLAESGDDEEFRKKWVLCMTMLLKRGLHLNMIHNVDRPVNEMLLGLESWIPIYMTGSISPYYFKNPPSNFFKISHCTSGSIALTSECINNNEKNSRFYLTTKKEELEFEKSISKVLLSKAKPLMDIFKEADKNKFENFMNQYKNSNLKTVKKDCFKNIDFYINDNEWIMINKQISPEIHFVIYNQKLINAIKSFLDN